MSSELEEIYKLKKSVSAKNELAEVQRQKEILDEMKGLGLSEEEYKEFLEKRDSYIPTLYDVNRILDDTIVCEYTSRMSVFLAFILAKQNVYVSGLSGSGKSQIMSGVTSLVMPKDLCMINGGSEKNLLERKYDINKCKWLVISEINKVDSTLTIEYLKTAAEGKVYTYDRGGVNKCHIELEPRSWIISRADESAQTNPIGVEMMSRLVEIVTDSSAEQTLNILNRKADNYKFPLKVNKMDMVKKACLRWHISQLPAVDLCINPAADLLADIIPTVFVSARRKYDQYALNCEAMTKFHWKNRMTVDIGGKKILFVTPIDIWQTHLIFGQHLIDAALQISSIQKLIMKIIIEEGPSTKQEVQRYLRTYSLNLATKVIETHLSHLNDLGYVAVDKPSKELVYTHTDFYKHFELNPNMQKIVDCCKYTMLTEPDYQPFAEEYIERFCNPNNMHVLNPFTGECVDILSYDFGNVFGVEEGSTRMKVVETEEPKKKTFSLTDFM